MLNTRYKDKDGNVEKLDGKGNHFINGKCVNPKSWEVVEIGDTFDPEGLVECSVQDELEITGHVDKFMYYDHDIREIVYVSTAHENL